MISFGSALTGLTNSLSRFDRASTRMAQPETTDPIADRAEQLVAKHEVAANVAVARTADDMIGTLINIVA